MTKKAKAKAKARQGARTDLNNDIPQNSAESKPIDTGEAQFIAFLEQHEDSDLSLMQWVTGWATACDRTPEAFGCGIAWLFFAECRQQLQDGGRMKAKVIPERKSIDIMKV